MRFTVCLAMLVVGCREPQGSSLAALTSASATAPSPTSSASAATAPPSPSTSATNGGPGPASIAASGRPIDGCTPIEPRKVGLRGTAPLSTTFSFEGGALAVCIDSALFPYAQGRGHRLFTTFRARFGDDVQSYRAEEHSRLAFHGYSIEVGLEKASHSGQSEVWLEVDRSGADTKL